MSDENAAKRRKRNIVVGIIVLLIGIAAGAFASTLVSDDDTGQAAGEIILAPAGEVGADPFSSDPMAPAPDPKLAQAATPISTPITAPAVQALTGASGGTPGLYGGTKDKASCDAQKMVDFLAANPDKAAAWVDALNADPAVALPDGSKLTVATIPQYVASLTPLVLRDDTRVTNHGFKNGKANPLQSVLQKGSAVLVDNKGVPRAKCFCGNPLVPPVASKVAPTYVGSTWPDFNPAKITVIVQNKTVINNFTVTDLATGNPFVLKAGSTITPPKGTTTTTTSAAASSTTTGATTTATTAPPATTTTAAPTTTKVPATTTAPTSSAVPPEIIDATLVRDPGSDNSCTQSIGGGNKGYTIKLSFTDANGDGDSRVAVGDIWAPGTFSGTGSSGSFTGTTCAVPGKSALVKMIDKAGNFSSTVEVAAYP